MKTRTVVAAVSAVVIATIAFWAVPGLASAQKGGKGPTAMTSGPTIALHAGSELWLGGNVSFDSSAPGVKNLRIQVACTAIGGGPEIWASTGTWDHVFLLGGGSSDWLAAPQAAHCQADLYAIVWNGNNPQVWTTYASTSFDAYAAAP